MILEKRELQQKWNEKRCEKIFFTSLSLIIEYYGGGFTFFCFNIFFVDSLVDWMELMVN